MYSQLICLVIVLFSGVFHVLAQPKRGAASRPAAERRLALVIGNGNYQQAPLRNPVNDANDIAAVLESVGFEVALKSDLDKDSLKRAVSDFGQRLKRENGVGLFYFAGHGMQVKGINYLLPVKANINSEADVEYEAIEAGYVLAQMEAANNSLNIIILDACRNNPFPRGSRSADRGLATMNAPTGSLIAYSTAPGSVAADGTGRNSAYTAALINELRKPDIELKSIFQNVRVAVRNETQTRQTPWESLSTTRDFYFLLTDKNAGNNPPPLLKPIESKPTPAPNYEITFWESIKDSTDLADFQEYLVKYPKGQFANLAQRRINKLKAANNKTDTGEPPPDTLTRSWTVDSSLFAIELAKCRLSGTTVFCDFNITNNDKDRNLTIHSGASLFDDFNNQTKSHRIELANDASYSVTRYLVQGVKTNARIIFNNVAQNATVARLISIRMNSTNTQPFTVEFRNIPLKEGARGFTPGNGSELQAGAEAPASTETDRSNNSKTFTVTPRNGWVDSGLNVSPGMKITASVTGRLQVKVDNKPLDDLLGSITKGRTRGKVPPMTRSVGGEAVITKIRYQNGGDSQTLKVGNSNTLRIEQGEYGRLYFAIDKNYSSGAGELTVTLKW